MSACLVITWYIHRTSTSLVRLIFPMYYVHTCKCVRQDPHFWSQDTDITIWRWEVYVTTQVGENVINTLWPIHICRHFANDIFKCIFLNENALISFKISMKFVPKVRINNIPALVQIMARRRPGDKPLSEPMMASLLTYICVTRPQWVKFNWPLFTRRLILIHFLIEKLLCYDPNINETLQWRHNERDGVSNRQPHDCFFSTFYSDADQRKHQSSASLAFVRGIHRGPVNSPHKWPVTPKMFPFDDVIMNLFPRAHLTISELWIRQWLCAKQAITWTSDEP